MSTSEADEQDGMTMQRSVGASQVQSRGKLSEIYNSRATPRRLNSRGKHALENKQVFSFHDAILNAYCFTILLQDNYYKYK